MTEPKPAKSALPAVLLLALPIAVAAALLALRLHFQPPTVPPYAIEEVGGEDGGSGEVPVAHGGSFGVVARPEGPVVGAVAARGFLVRGTEVRPWDPPFDVARDGTIRIAGPVDRLFAGVADGPWDVALAVGRPETLPTAPADILRTHAQTGDAAWRLLRERIVLR